MKKENDSKKTSIESRETEKNNDGDFLSPKTENVKLKQKIGMLVTQESALFSALEVRLKDLEEAKTKLVKLSTNIAAGTYNTLQEVRLEELKELEERLEASESRNVALEEELRTYRTKATELQFLLEQRTRQAEVAENLSKKTLEELLKVRQDQRLVLRETMSLVTKHVSEGQDRRSIDFTHSRDDSLESIESDEEI